MNNIDVSIDKLYGTGEIFDRISNGLNLADKDVNYLSVDDLSPVDEFHTRGRESTLEVTELVQVKPSDVVLEVGCGLGGTARYLANLYGCRVTQAAGLVVRHAFEHFDVHSVLYLSLEQMGDNEIVRDGIHRTQIELTAARTSWLNDCFY